MTNLKPILVIATMFLAVVMLWQVASITGFLTNETIPANVTIGNEVPTVNTIHCSTSGDADGTLTPVACTNVTAQCWAFVTDENGANDISYVEGSLGEFETGKLCGFPDFTTMLVAKQIYVSNCTSYTDVNATTRNYTCTFNGFRHWTGLDYRACEWTGKMRASDTTTTGSITESANNLTTTNITALDMIETFLGFGSMTLGETTSNDSEVNSTIQNCGNSDIDLNVSGTNLPCNTQGTIPVGSLHYNNETFGTDYDSDTALLTESIKFRNALSTANDDRGINGSTHIGWDKIYWQISIPTTGVKGLCTGNITFYAIAN